MAHGAGRGGVSDSPRIDRPQPGYYATRMVRGGPLVGCRIWWEEPRDPVTGELMDRPPMMVAKRGGQWIDPHTLWVSVAGRNVSEAEYKFLVGDAAWAAQNAPADPSANPRKAIDLNAMPSLF